MLSTALRFVIIYRRLEAIQEVAAPWLFPSLTIRSGVALSSSSLVAEPRRGERCLLLLLLLLVVAKPGDYFSGKYYRKEGGRPGDRGPNYILISSPIFSRVYNKHSSELLCLVDPPFFYCYFLSLWNLFSIQLDKNSRLGRFNADSVAASTSSNERGLWLLLQCTRCVTTLDAINLSTLMRISGRYCNQHLWFKQQPSRVGPSFHVGDTLWAWRQPHSCACVCDKLDDGRKGRRRKCPTAVLCENLR